MTTTTENAPAPIFDGTVSAAELLPQPDQSPGPASLAAFALPEDGRHLRHHR